jgi:Double-GTPase 2
VRDRASGQLRRSASFLDGLINATSQKRVDLTRNCPNCGTRINLLDCDIVATLGSNKTPGNAGQFDDLDSPTQHQDSTTTPGYEVLVKSRASRSTGSGSIVEDLRGGLVNTQEVLRRPTDMAEAGRMPRRLCPVCQTPLPLELDECNAAIVAVVGVTKAGKTHFLAQALYEGTQQGSLKRFGCGDFRPTDAENTSHSLHSDYYTRLFDARTTFDPTQRETAPKRFTLTATLDGVPSLLVLHDVAGEALSSPERRATDLSFLRRADALIFLVDPLELEKVRRTVPRIMVTPRSASQIDLLGHCLDELRQSSRLRTPIVVAVSKADLLGSVLGVHGAWEAPSSEDWVENSRQVRLDVEAFLGEWGGAQILNAVDSFPRVAFTAFSALGAEPDGTTLADAEPYGCSDVLGTALHGVATAFQT